MSEQKSTTRERTFDDFKRLVEKLEIFIQPDIFRVPPLPDVSIEPSKELPENRHQAANQVLGEIGVESGLIDSFVVENLIAGGLDDEQLLDRLDKRWRARRAERLQKNLALAAIIAQEMQDYIDENSTGENND